jgi:hypothetical protein
VKSGNGRACDLRAIMTVSEARFERFVLPLATIFGLFGDIHRASKDWVHSGLQTVKLNAFNDLTCGTGANTSKWNHRSNSIGLNPTLSAMLLKAL